MAKEGEALEALCEHINTSFRKLEWLRDKMQKV
jgi:hypothetical protein